MNKSILFFIEVILLLEILCLVSAIPLISFVPPTPTHGLTTTNNSVGINISVTEQNLRNLTYVFNNTNYTLYEDDLMLFYNGNTTNDTILMRVYEDNKTAQFDFSSSNSAAGIIFAMNFNNQSYLKENATYAADISGYNNNGTINGSVWNSSGKFGGAYYFNGTNKVIKVLSNNLYNFNSSQNFQ